MWVLHSCNELPLHICIIGAIYNFYAYANYVLLHICSSFPYVYLQKLFIFSALPAEVDTFCVLVKKTQTDTCILLETFLGWLYCIWIIKCLTFPYIISCRNERRVRLQNPTKPNISFNKFAIATLPFWDNLAPCDIFKPFNLVLFLLNWIFDFSFLYSKINVIYLSG